MRARVSEAGRGASFIIFLRDASLPSALFKGGEESLESSEEDKQTSGRPPDEESDIGENSLDSLSTVGTADCLCSVSSLLTLNNDKAI